MRHANPAERQLVYQLGDGWEPLCAFLGRPVPDHDFPHVNSRSACQQLRKQQLPADDA